MEKTLNQNEEPQKNKKGIIDWLKKNYLPTRSGDPR